jgi:hypothetical protein
LSSVRHFFSVARHTIIVCKLSLKEGEDNLDYPANRAISTELKR